MLYTHALPFSVAVPSQAYRKEEEETDELLLFDEECMDLDPEYLPRRLLTDFSIYNAEVGAVLPLALEALCPLRFVQTRFALQHRQVHQRAACGPLPTWISPPHPPPHHHHPPTHPPTRLCDHRACFLPWSCCPCGVAWTLMWSSTPPVRT